MVPEICSGQKTMDGGRRTPHAARRTDIWITKSLPELNSGETRKKKKISTFNEQFCNYSAINLLYKFQSHFRQSASFRGLHPLTPTKGLCPLDPR